VRKGSQILLSFITPGDGAGERVVVPDLRGLSIRKARRMLIESSLRSRITGSGMVLRQDPSPGRRVSRGSTVSIRCRVSKRGAGAGYALAGGVSR
jgi:stage V sporulation protein D (sporulation-specific penicillin-binding protein)